MTNIVGAATEGIATLSTNAGTVLVAAFGVVLIFVLYKVIRRAVNKV